MPKGLLFGPDLRRLDRPDLPPKFKKTKKKTKRKVMSRSKGESRSKVQRDRTREERKEKRRDRLLMRAQRREEEKTEVNTSSYPGTLVPGLFFHSRAVIFKSGCFVQKYWSGTVTRKTVIQRADDY